MTSTTPYRPRLSTELEQHQYDRLQQILPHGWQKPLIQCLIDGILQLYDTGGIEAISAVIAKFIDAKTIAEAGISRHTSSKEEHF